MDGLDILPVFLFLRAKCIPFRTFLYIIFNTLSVPNILGKTFSLVCLCPLDIVIQVIHGNIIYLAFDILQISHLLGVGDFL